mmetsp:Transcript_2748/g.4702  ORF Transcript_2748/g.4702 Transcript_2748/m.4702 type:complete len:211 (-) Transcript_2748:143-775(-)
MPEEQKADFHWPPLESNPEVFTSYLQRVGMSKEWAVGEVFGFDEELLSFLPQPIIGVIVALQRLKKESDVELGSEANNDLVPFYMKQTGTLDNACGVIACLHVTLNKLDQVNLDAGSILDQFYQDIQNKTPDERATVLESSDQFKEQHKEFAAQGQSNEASTQDDVKHHFVAFILNSSNQLIELDGTKKGPHIVAENCEEGVLRGAIKEI